MLRVNIVSPSVMVGYQVASTLGIHYQKTSHDIFPVFTNGFQMFVQTGENKYRSLAPEFDFEDVCGLSILAIYPVGINKSKSSVSLAVQRYIDRLRLIVSEFITPDKPDSRLFLMPNVSIPTLPQMLVQAIGHDTKVISTLEFSREYLDLPKDVLTEIC